MRKLVTFAAFVVALVLPAAASADAGGYGSQPGYSVATGNTICAYHGAFGVYDHAGIPTLYPDPHTRAADGTQTGLNNGLLCGNRQSNLP